MTTKKNTPVKKSTPVKKNVTVKKSATKKSTPDTKKSTTNLKTKISKVGNKVTTFLKNKDNQKKIIAAGQIGLGSYALYNLSKTLIGRSFLDDTKKGILHYIPISKNVLGKLFKDRYEILRPLGAGAFGTVTLAKIKDTEKLVVIKGIEIQYDNVRQEQSVQTELTILKLFKKNCEYVSCYIEDKVDDEEITTPPTIIDGKQLITSSKRIYKTLYIVQKYDYPDNLEKVYTTEKFDKIRDKVIENLMKGLQVLHKNYVTHNDIKLENIIVNKETGDIKYIDFGVSCYKKCNLTLAGSYPYMSTEFKKRAIKLVNKQPLQIFSFDSAKSNDIWSLGVLIFILINKIKYIDDKTLTIATDKDNMIKKINEDTNENNKSINELLLKIFVDEKDRITLDKLLKDYNITTTITKPTSNFFSYFF